MSSAPPAQHHDPSRHGHHLSHLAVNHPRHCQQGLKQSPVAPPRLQPQDKNRNENRNENKNLNRNYSPATPHLRSPALSTMTAITDMTNIMPPSTTAAATTGTTSTPGLGPPSAHKTEPQNSHNSMHSHLLTHPLPPHSSSPSSPSQAPDDDHGALTNPTTTPSPNSNSNINMSTPTRATKSKKNNISGKINKIANSNSNINNMNNQQLPGLPSTSTQPVLTPPQQSRPMPPKSRPPMTSLPQPQPPQQHQQPHPTPPSVNPTSPLPPPQPQTHPHFQQCLSAKPTTATTASMPQPQPQDQPPQLRSPSPPATPRKAKGGRKAANPHLTEEQRRRERVLKNRESAMKSLQKKKRYTQNLEHRAVALAARNAELRDKIRLLLLRLNHVNPAAAAAAAAAANRPQPGNGHGGAIRGGVSGGGAATMTTATTAVLPPTMMQGHTTSSNPCTGPMNPGPSPMMTTSPVPTTAAMITMTPDGIGQTGAGEGIAASAGKLSHHVNFDHQQRQHMLQRNPQHGYTTSYGLTASSSVESSPAIQPSIPPGHGMPPRLAFGPAVAAPPSSQPSTTGSQVPPIAAGSIAQVEQGQIPSADADWRAALAHFVHPPPVLDDADDLVDAPCADLGSGGGGNTGSTLAPSPSPPQAPSRPDGGEGSTIDGGEHDPGRTKTEVGMAESPQSRSSGESEYALPTHDLGDSMAQF